MLFFIRAKVQHFLSIVDQNSALGFSLSNIKRASEDGNLGLTDVLDHT
jgi:hypothetical protein